MKKISREKRIEQILKSLFEGKRVSSKELALKYGVDIRSIQKDIKEIKQIYPLQKEKKEYFLDENYILKETQEIHPLAMDIAMNIIKKTLPNYIEIIQNSIDTKINDIFLFDFEIEEIKDESIFLKLKNSIIDKKAINFKYKNHKKNVFPLKISNFNSYWYLIGYDLEAQIIKTFYLDDISDIHFYEDKFIEFDLLKKLQNLKITSSWYNGKLQKTNLILLNDAKKYILRRTPSNIKILNKTPEELEIEFEYYNKIELFNFLKKWLGNIKIKDENIKKEFIQILNEGLEVIKSD